MEVTLELIIALPKQHYYNPKHTWQLCPHVGPMLVEAVILPQVGSVSSVASTIQASRTLGMAPIPPLINLLSIS